MFALLWQSVRRQGRLARRFDEMRRTYRAALPALSSKQKWETSLSPASGWYPQPSKDSVPGNG
jgi:galactofuranosylgalactofuranosylrhamnosyl-N-acetylglucosaminyl-diphospho-decaprenol beta-1,5/1,6-galactofuranosyltransferase